MSPRRLGLFPLGPGILLLFLASCSVLQEGAKVLSPENVTKAASSPVVKSAAKLRSSFADITEEEEYFIGRSVAALILSRYNVLQNEALNSYVNLLGNAVALSSARPEIYGGYHFLVLDSEEVNALAAPGGFIFITKGLVKRCEDEEMLAAVLAHEVGHVAHRHGLQAIKKSRLVEAFALLGKAAAEKYSPAELSQLTGLFENALADIFEELVEKGYDRKLEYEADSLSLKFSAGTGYNPEGLADFLEIIAGESGKAEGKGWFRTHPTPDQRLERVSKQIRGMGPLPRKEQVRTARFKQHTARLK